MAAQAKRTAVMNDIWSRPGLSNTNLDEMLQDFMTSNDACFVTLLFESSKKRPFAADAFALRGTKTSVSDYRVQACAILFCIANKGLMVSRGRSLKESIIHDVHSTNPSHFRGAADNAAPQPDAEWFRQNCLPDILYILDSDREILDYELLGSSPLVDKLGPSADELLVELGDLVHEVVVESTEPVHSAHESAGDTMSFLEHGLDDTTYPPDDATNIKPNEHPDTHDYSILYPRYEEHQTQHPVEVAHHGAHPETADNGHAVDLKEDHQDNPNLYSTYLLKSHLRNNLQHEEQMYGGRGNRRFAGRHSGQAMRNKQGQQQSRTAVDAKGRDGPQGNRGSGKYSNPDQVSGHHETGHSNQKYSLKVAPTNAQDIPKLGSGIQHPRGSAADIPVSSTAVASLEGSARRRIASTSGVPSIGDVSAREGNNPDSGSDRNRVASIQNASAQPSQQAIRRSANTISTPSPAHRRTAQSIRSLFNPSLLLGMASHQAASQEHVPAVESAVEMRVRRGIRLRELFGSWDMRDSDIPEGFPALFLERDARRSSIHSFSFSTPTRASIGPRPTGVAAVATLGSALGAATTSYADEAGGGGLAYRLPRAAAASSISMDSDTPRRTAGEADTMTPLDQLRRFNQLLLPQPISRVPPAKEQQQQQQQQQHQPPPLHSGHSSSEAVAGVASETYTYLYARVGLPNVVMVAALLDTERGMARRSDAQREWDKIVDKVRGMTLFEQMMTAAG
ncbi:hypothetical protein GGI23_005528 [Coemansia sp. RSA 2559]|nr:hypothetical protein GGI23_005528 [Coemansia sp. RSA 2559]